MTERIARDDLVPGEQYLITFDDCCAQGWFSSTFIEINDDGQCVFATGAIGPDWGSWWVEGA